MAVFDRILQDFSGQETMEGVLDQYMDSPYSLSLKAIQRIPLRYRLVLRGFTDNLSLEEVNQELKEAGCEQLYARNLDEISFIYAFRNHLTYKDWKKLNDKCRQVMAGWQPTEQYFTKSSTTYRELKTYVWRNSVKKDDRLVTRQITFYLNEWTARTARDETEFMKFLNENCQYFSHVRENTRYYFCKYLCNYIDNGIDKFLEKRKWFFGRNAAIPDSISILKAASKLRNKKMSKEETWEIFLDSSISYRNIFDLFNYFYFDYVTSDWLDVMLDYYSGDIRALPKNQKANLAKALRIYYPKQRAQNDEEIIAWKWQHMEENEKILDRQYSLEEGSNRGYQNNRSGENWVRDFIKGNVDINRTAFICYLIFFDRKMKEQTLNDILNKCGFSTLRIKDEFDSFIISYLASSDPEDYLMETVTKYAFEQKDFFLYRLYRGAVSYEKAFENLI